MDKKQIAFEKAVLDAHRNLSDGAGLSFYNIFKAGYDYATEELEITRQQVIDKACKHVNDQWDKLLVYDYNQYGGCVFNRQKTVEQFKQALEK